MSIAEQPAAPTSPRRWARHKWFPALVIASTVGWWLYRAQYAEYTTLLHAIVIVASLLLISGWYLACGALSWKHRLTVVGILWTALIGFRLLFRPVYNGDMGVVSWRFRFAPAADQLLQQITSSNEASDWQATPRDYPRFLGNGYWAEVEGVELETDWKSHPPQEVWRHEIGGGWSGFAVVGNYAVTQEQRGEHELVSCYRVDTGEPVWTHSDSTRFDPGTFSGDLGDIGPRATPTIHGNRVITQGGTGYVNCLDARTGHVVWSHNTAEEFGATVTLWGKAGSPLVVDDMVVVSVGAPTDAAAAAAAANASGEPNAAKPAAGKSGAVGGSAATVSASSSPADYDSSLVAFDLETGTVRWAAGKRQSSYASPVVTTLTGERQIVMINDSYVTAHRASDGKVLWEFPWAHENDQSATASQPIPLDGDRIFLSKGYGVGACMLTLGRDENGDLQAEPVWDPPIKPVMKTKFCNVVLRGGYVYGLDDVLLECIKLDTGEVRWKKRRRPEFGHGQVLLIGNVLLVQSEKGELALVEASPEQYRELASLQVLDEANVTWNNPAFAPPYLLVRNAREAACYRLPLKGDAVHQSRQASRTDSR